MNPNSHSDWQKIHDELRNDPAAQQSIRALGNSQHGEQVLGISRQNWLNKGFERAPFDFIFDESDELQSEDNSYDARLAKSKAEIALWPEARKVDTNRYRVSMNNGSDPKMAQALNQLADNIDELQTIKEHLFDMAAHGYAGQSIAPAERTDISLTAKQLATVISEIDQTLQTL